MSKILGSPDAKPSCWVNQSSCQRPDTPSVVLSQVPEQVPSVGVCRWTMKTIKLAEWSSHPQGRIRGAVPQAHRWDSQTLMETARKNVFTWKRTIDGPGTPRGGPCAQNPVLCAWDRRTNAAFEKRACQTKFTQRDGSLHCMHRQVCCAFSPRERDAERQQQNAHCTKSGSRRAVVSANGQIWHCYFDTLEWSLVFINLCISD